MSSLPLPANYADLLGGTTTGIIATVGADGVPQATPVWFAVVDGRIHVSVRSTSRKARNLQARPGVAFTLFDPDNPQRHLQVRGRARVWVDEDLAVLDAVGAKYGIDARSYDPPGTVRVAIAIDATAITGRPTPA